MRIHGLTTTAAQTLCLAGTSHAFAQPPYRPNVLRQLAQSVQADIDDESP